MKNIETVNKEFKNRQEIIEAIRVVNDRIKSIGNRTESIETILRDIDANPTTAMAKKEFNTLVNNYYDISFINTEPKHEFYELLKPYDDENLVDTIGSILIDYKRILERQIEALNSRLDYLSILLVKS